MAKDLFSEQASLYARYRPTYPDELFNYITSFVPDRETVWDCATGNGQAAVKLSRYFKKVIATDISEAQLSKATPGENITYLLAPAERTPFADNTFDLITIATAYHWLNWEQFRAEATRVGKPGAVVAAWTYYNLLTDDESLDALFHHFYKEIIHPYWDYERRYVDERYETVAFDFEPLPSRPFHSQLPWTREHFKGYLESWSAVQRYKETHHTSPLALIEEDLARIWPVGETKKITFPIALRLGRI
ncbi:MAG TPA: class I SAM-dependent methyltransferase [Chitinophagaceae bacterium]